MTGLAHVSAGAAFAAACGNRWWACLAFALVSHPVLDMAARYHPAHLFRADTWGKRIQLAANGLMLVAFALLFAFKPTTRAPILWGLLAWLWADVWWALRYVWPAADKLNPHRWWWIRGHEHEQHQVGLWWELAVMLLGAAMVPLL